MPLGQGGRQKRPGVTWGLLNKFNSRLKTHGQTAPKSPEDIDSDALSIVESLAPHEVILNEQDSIISSNPPVSRSEELFLFTPTFLSSLSMFQKQKAMHKQGIDQLLAQTCPTALNIVDQLYSACVGQFPVVGQFITIVKKYYEMKQVSSFQADANLGRVHLAFFSVES